MANNSTKKRKRRSPGWVPDQHGAWAMLAVPLVVGIWLGGAVWTHVPLAITWVVGYFAFFAAGLWVKSRRKPKYLPPLRFYALAAIPFGAATLIMEPRLAWWAVAFAPLLSVSIVCSHLRKDRSLVNDFVTVLAACLMLLVAYHASVLAGGAPGAGWEAVWVAFALVFAYFFGTVLYVKTMIREKGSAPYFYASSVYHLATILLPLVFFVAFPQAGLGKGGALMLTAIFGVCAVRAIVMPKRGATPKQVGLGEVAISLALTGALIFAL